MNASANSNVKFLDEDEDVVALAGEWGWTNPPVEIFRMAEKSLFARKTKSGEILVKWHYIDELTRDRLLLKKPEDIQTLSYFASQEPVRVLPYKEQILALKNGYPFYDRISLMIQHSAMSTPAVHKRCEELDVVLMLAEGIAPVLVFSSFATLVSFMTQGSGKKKDEVLIKANHGAMPRLAVGSRDEISFILKSYSVDAGDFGSETGSKVWSTVAEDMQSPEAKELGRLFDHALQKGATDISFKPFRDGSAQVLIRRWGSLISPFAADNHAANSSFKLSADLTNKAINLLMSFSGANQDATRKRVPTDGQITYKSTTADAFMRLSFIPLNHLGESRDLRSVSIRLFSRTESSIRLEDLNIQPEVADLIRDAVRMPQGLILFSGPVNSGKSTAIAGAIGEHVEVYGDTEKRISVEDPIERHVYGVIQVNVPTHLREQTDRYNVILRAVKRHDLNVLWVGEVRDREGAEFCVGFAGSGHLVLSTIHAKDTILAYDILSNLVEPGVRFQLAESMALSVGLRLVKTLCPACSPEEGWSEPNDAERRLFALNLKMLGETETLPKKIPRANSHPQRGCSCEGGYAGSVPVCEALPFTREVRDAAIALIGGGDVRTQRKIMADARAVTLLQSGLQLLRQGKVDLDSILFF